MLEVLLGLGVKPAGMWRVPAVSSRPKCLV